jgi:hypothetical protein
MTILISLLGSKLPLITRHSHLKNDETLPNICIASIECGAQISVELHELRASPCVRFAHHLRAHQSEHRGVRRRQPMKLVVR